MAIQITFWKMKVLFQTGTAFLFGSVVMPDEAYANRNVINN